MNQAEYFQANAVDGQLTDAQMMHMLGLPEGEITTDPVPEVKNSEPPAADVPASNDDKAEPTPVLLAKDGVHTIPYDKLVEARQEGSHWKQVAAQAQAQLEAAIAAANEARKPGAQEVTATEVTADDADLFGDFSEEAIRKGVNTLVARQVAAIQAEMDAKLAQALEPIKHKEAMSEADSHFGAIEKAHPDVESVVQSDAMEKWIESHPSYARPALRAVIEGGTAAEVIELLDNFKEAQGTSKTAASQDVAVAAKAAIAKAKVAVPTSLSEIPAGAAVPTNSAEQMAEMSDRALMNMFDGKTPEQINALLSKVI